MKKQQIMQELIGLAIFILIIFIDEVQDLVGYDLELIKLFFQSSLTVILVGDPRQTAYLTHHELMYKKYKNNFRL